MPELPIYPDRVREAPGYALERRLARTAGLSTELRGEAHHRLRVECAYETLRLTGAGVERAEVARFAEALRRGERVEGGALVPGQVEALEMVERAARDGSLSLVLVRDVHQRANPPSEGELRSEDSAPQFRNARPSSYRFVEERLQNLFDWLSSESGRAMFPAERMALWFPRFLEIAPFPRGNFRTAHLLLSFFSCAAGFPPVSLRFEDADDVRAEIEKAFLFETYPLVARFSSALERSVGVLESFGGGQSS